MSVMSASLHAAHTCLMFLSWLLEKHLSSNKFVEIFMSNRIALFLFFLATVVVDEKVTCERDDAFLQFHPPRSGWLLIESSSVSLLQRPYSFLFFSLTIFIVVIIYGARIFTTLVGVSNKGEELSFNVCDAATTSIIREICDTACRRSRLRF